MKSVLIIGMSTFGQHLLMEFSKKDAEVMIVDKDENVITPMLDYAISAKIADCTKPGVLESFGVDEFDRCFVCLGGHFTESLEVTYQLKELGAKRVISEVNRDIEKKFLLRNGADAVIYPEEDIAIRTVGMEISDNIFDAISLADGFMIYEIAVPEIWAGKNLKDLKIREKYDISIIAKKIGEHLIPVISPDSILEKSEHIFVVCNEDKLKKII